VILCNKHFTNLETADCRRDRGLT